ncbi:MAG: ATP-binding protein [Desulfurivibrionaceae bacterium]|jgi:PAS domain S-box-containing protein
MYSPLIELTYNLATLIAMCAMSGFIRQRWEDKAWQAILQGVLFGAAALTGMMHPLMLGPGLIFDGRSVVISLCGLFFGPLAVSVTAGMAAFYRIILGGDGAYMGVLVIASSALLGFAFHCRWKRRGVTLTAGRLLSVGLLVHVIMLLLLFTLPAGKGLDVFKRLGLPILLIYPLATLIIGMLLSSQEAGIRTLRALQLTKISVEAASDALFWMTPDARIVDVNKAACHSLGYTREELLQLTVPDVDTHYDAEAWQQHFSELQKHGTLMLESEHRAKDGKVFPVEIAANYVKVGTEEYNCAFVRNITDRKLAEMDRVEMETRLLQSQKMEAMGTLAGGIAHDFNNILSVIFGYTELAKREDGDPEKRREELDQVLKSACRAKDLVQQILAFSRKTEQQQQQPLQISLIIKEALKMLRSSIPSTIEIKQDIRSTGTVLADATQIHQITMNLCTNAYHAMRETGGTLAVSLNEVEIRKDDEEYGELAPGRYLKLEVSDTGSGISPEVKDKIFEPYFTTKKTGEGTGLGLAVVHGIIKSHHGHIAVYSEPGKGATFQVYLPLVENKAVELPIQVAVADLAGKGERILFVDDEEQIRAFADRLFSTNGYQVTSCKHGAEAFDAFQNSPDQFDLVITDMTMPYLTGAELAQKILAIRPEMPIILCSGHSELMNKQKALAMGVCEYLSKPVLQHDFLSAVRRILKKDNSQHLPG